MSEKFDVIVIGAGPAGLSAAYFLSKYGFETLVLERGAELGSKNIFGGRIYSYPFDKFFEGWRDEAPIERWVRSERFITLCDGNDVVSIEFKRGGGEGYDSFTTFLSNFLSWMGDLVESNGGIIATGVKADNVILSEGYVKEVEAGGDRIEADYIIFAEGVNSILLEKLGFKKKPSYNAYAVGVKEVFKVGREKINVFFGLEDEEGVAAYVMGGALKGLRGGGFIYTMKDYISIGIVIHLKEAFNKNIYIKDIIEDFRLHKYYKKLFEEASLVEYSARLISEGGYLNLLEEPFGNGYIVVGDSAGYVLNTGFTVRGVDYAVLSGKYAADAIKYSHSKGSRDSSTLKIYREYIEKSPIYRGLVKFKKSYKVLDKEFLYRNMPDILCNVFSKVYTLDEEPYKLYDALKDELSKEGVFLINLLKLWNMVRNI